MKQYMPLFFRILLGGLLIHFVVLTFLEYRLGLQGTGLTIVALWKEIALVAWTLGLVAFHYDSIVSLWKKDVIFRYASIIFIATIAITLGVAAIQGFTMSSYVMAARYNFIGFWIMLLAYVSGTMIDRKQYKSLSKWYITVIKIVLIMSLVWYSAIVIKPGVLKYLGYSKHVYEGQVGQQPPAVYYSEMTSGIQRNQFVFERPITFGFWLVAFWPLFFVAVLRRQPFSQTWMRWFLYSAAIILTYSRAARGTWIIQTMLLGYWTYQTTFKDFLRRFIAPMIVILIGVGYLGFHQIFGGGRQFSNTGHINALITSIHAFADRPLFGRGPGSVGPASHHFGLGYNTENQFLQILVEYGLVGFTGWFILFMASIIGALLMFINKLKQVKVSKYIIAYGIGMLGLAISGVVLHTWVDRMIVRPMALLIGVSRGMYYKQAKQQ